jgi:flagellar basal-body rod protein FlgF
VELPSYVALSYLTAQGRALEVHAANLANAVTSGFKTERVLFSDWLARQNPGPDGAGGAMARSPVAFVQDRATYRDQTPGAMTPTGNPLDLAITGDGFFTVDTPRGPRLTRAGRFSPQSDGTIADHEGNALLDTAGQKLQLSAADLTLTIGGDGSIRSENGRIGQVGVVQPQDTTRMQAEGSTTFRSDSATAPVEQPRILQGAVEESNVQPVLEMTQMMSGLRSFQFAAQFIEGEATRQQSAIDKITQRKG